MAFRGVFIGIDRYQSDQISWLNCAQRDARALYSLFSDNFGGDCLLLTESDAELERIESSLKALESAKEDDVVVISYSGHGSDTHEIVAYDTELSRLNETGIALSELGDLIQKIPAKRVVVLLDCCFSGGIGVKGVTSPVKPRAVASIDNQLNKISGEGRIILTASRADEYAYEIQKFGHGLLTYLIIEALLGAEEIRKNGKINTYDLLSHVTLRVEVESNKIGRVQHPTLRGTVDGSFMWPTFTKGPTYFQHFPESDIPPVTSEITSLANYGFPERLISQWSHHIPSLNDLQVSAINDFNVLSGEDLVVSAPTSSGKTMIGEIASLKGILNRKRALFLLPLKAIVGEKSRHFRAMYSGYGIKVIKATGDSNDDVPDLLSGRYDICLLTYEKFTALMLANPGMIEGVGTVVVDEVQMIADKSRGANLEFILTLLNMVRKRFSTPQLICLSAVIGDTNGLERWLGGRLLLREERPVPLDEGILTSAGTFRFVESDTTEEKSQPNFAQRVFRKNSSQDYIIPLVRKLVKEGKQVIVFREVKGETRGAAQYLAAELGLPPADSAIESLPSGDPSQLSAALRTSLQGGVAIHNADLDPDERRVIEEHFRASNSQIRVIVATTTLAMGVNTPAEAVVVAGLNHPGKPKVPYAVAEYKNIVGRAGRLGFAKRGQSFLLALDSHTEHDYWNKYVKGSPEDLESRFFQASADIRTLVVRVLASARSSSGTHLVGMSAEDIIGFLESSFGAFQLMQDNPSWSLNHQDVAAALGDLQSVEMTTTLDNGKYALTALGWLAGHAGIEVESVIRLARIFQSIAQEEITDPCVIAAVQCTLELDDVYMLLNSKGLRKETETWSGELRNQGIPDSVVSFSLRTANSDYQAASRAKRAAACLLWISDTPMSQIEDILTKHGRKFDGAAGPVRSVSSRTNDLLSIAFRVAELIHPKIVLDDRVPRLSTRLESGVSASMTNIALYLGNQLSRSDYHLISKAGIGSLDDLNSVGDDALMKLLGGDRWKVEAVKTAMIRARADEGTDGLEAPLIPDYES